MTSPTNESWPALAYEDWADACNTLHLWTQVVGKVKLALAPLTNHWWGVVLYVSARGLTTGAMPYRDRALQIDFDFCAHQLVLHTSDAREERIALSNMPTAEFYAAVMRALRALDVDVRIWTMPSEIERAIPFEQDRVHASYDAAAANAFWRQLVQADRVFNAFRARFLGKTSPSHFFWGSFDLAVTRFSGRTAPPLTSNATPNVADWVMNEAYSTNARASASGPATAATARRRSMPTRIPSRRASAPQRSRRRARPTTPTSGSFCWITTRCAPPHRRTMRCSTSCRAPTRRQRTRVGGIEERWSEG